MSFNQYNAQAAATINIDDIASSYTNRSILLRLQSGDCPVFKELWIRHEVDDEQIEEDYVPESSHDMGWLGYFIGKNEPLKTLNVRQFDPPEGESVSDLLIPFLEGVSTNKSMQELDIHDMDMVECRLFTILYPFFKNNQCLKSIAFHRCAFGVEGCRLFASTLGNSTNKSLEIVELDSNGTAEEGLVDIITALSIYPQLKTLSLIGNHLSTIGCIALATLLQHSSTKLKHLRLSNNEINDEGIEALVPILAHHNHLHSLKLCNNQSVTSKGWQQLSIILRNPNSKLTTLQISNNHIDDEVVATYAASLTNNGALVTLDLGLILGGLKGTSSFKHLLCDTSSVNSTFLSNHIIQHLTIMDPSIDRLNEVNRRNDKKEVAMVKILQHHNDFDMLPFFEWDFKVLPLMIDWFERASLITMPRNFEPNIGPRKLSCIYQYVRGMPLLYVEARLRKELDDIKAAELHLEEEKRRVALLQERKRSIIEKLGLPSS